MNSVRDRRLCGWRHRLTSLVRHIILQLIFQTLRSAAELADTGPEAASQFRQLLAAKQQKGRARDDEHCFWRNHGQSSSVGGSGMFETGKVFGRSARRNHSSLTPTQVDKCPV